MEEAGASSPHLDPPEQEQASQHAPLRALVIHEILREQGEHELQRKAGALFFSGLAAGLSMGFSFLATALLRSGMPEAPWRHLVVGLGYTLGFIIVVLGRQQLYTESTLTAALPAFTRRDAASFGAMLRLWAIVLVGNILGTWLYAAALTIPGLVQPPAFEALRGVAREAMGAPFLLGLVQAVFAGWLIALMVWLTPSAKAAKLFIIMLMTYLIALARFPHIVAGSTDIAFAVLIGDASAADYLVGFFLPTLLGNTVGGVALVALLNHAPISDELVPEAEQ